MEVKAKENISAQDVKALRFGEEKQVKRYLCVCLEARARKVAGIAILPWKEFLEALWSGEYG